VKAARTLVAALRRRPHRDKHLCQHRDVDQVERLGALHLKVTEDRRGCRVPSADKGTRGQVLDRQTVSVEDRALNRVRRRELAMLLTPVLPREAWSSTRSRGAGDGRGAPRAAAPARRGP
jgi:hypothetical protein